MKATIRRANGDVVEVEGLTDDVVRAVQALSPAPWAAPISVPFIRQWPDPLPYAPAITWTFTTNTTQEQT